MLRADGIAGRLSDTRLVLGLDSDARRPKSVQISARGCRRGNEICIEHLLGEVFECWLVVAEMEEGDLMARMPVALGALAGEKER